MPDGAVPETRIDVRAPSCEGRGDAILSLARAAFVEKGFDGASMQDLARAAGMSAGNFYRYFPSKAAIVEALVARETTEIEDGFRAIAASPDPVVALKATLREIMAEKCDDDDSLWAEISATALRRPEVAAVLARKEQAIVQRMTQVLALASGVAPEEAGARVGAHARLIFLIMRGVMSSGEDGPSREPVLHALLIRTLEGLIDDAVAHAKDPAR